MEPRLISRGNIFVGSGKVAIAKLLIGGTLLDPYARVSHRVLLHRLSFSAQARHDARALGRVDLVPVEAVEEQDAQVGIGRAWVGFQITSALAKSNISLIMRTRSLPERCLISSSKRAWTSGGVSVKSAPLVVVR
jgi:hypothetical protein